MFIKTFKRAVQTNLPDICKRFSAVEEQAIAEMFVRAEGLSRPFLPPLGTSLDAIKDSCVEKSAQPHISTLILSLALASLLELHAVRMMLREMVHGTTVQEMKATITRFVIQKACKKTSHFISALEEMQIHFEIAANFNLPPLILEAFRQVKKSMSERLEANNSNKVHQPENVTSTTTNQPEANSNRELHQPENVTSATSKQPDPKSCDRGTGMAICRDEASTVPESAPAVTRAECYFLENKPEKSMVDIYRIPSPLQREIGRLIDQGWEAAEPEIKPW